MPQLQTLVLTDRAATPVDHTFIPEQIVQGVGAVVESSGVPIGNSRVSVSTVRTQTGRYKSTVKYSFPKVQTETINGVDNPKVVRTAYADLTFTFEASSTEQERKDAVGMVMSSLDASKVLINDSVVKLQAVY